MTGTVAGILLTEQSIIAVIGAVGAIIVGVLTIFGTWFGVSASKGRKAAEIAAHESKPNSGSTQRDAVNRIEKIALDALAAAEHASRAARKSAEDTVQLREDVQQSRKESADNVAGLRKDIGRLTDAINAKENL